MRLTAVQNAFQRAILDGDDAVLHGLRDGAGEDRSTLLAVYRDGYVSRLTDVLRNEHPNLRAYLGDDAFEAMAQMYIAAHPSRTPNARYVPNALPAFLGAAHEWRTCPEVADLARIEKALNDAFDAEDAAVVDVAMLADVPPDRWAGLAITAHPAVVRLDLETNAFAIWSALQDDMPPPIRVIHAGPQALLVWRFGLAPMIRDMQREEANAWDAATGGAPFGAICEQLACQRPDAAAAQAAQFLGTWLQAGLISAVHIGP